MNSNYYFPPPPFPHIPPPSSNSNQPYPNPPHFPQWPPRVPPPPIQWPALRHSRPGFQPPPNWAIPPPVAPPPHLDQVSPAEKKMFHPPRYTQFQPPSPKPEMQTVQDEKQTKTARKRPEKVMKISDAKRLHRQAHILVKTLEAIKGEDSDKKKTELKAELDKILSILRDEKVVACLTAEVKKRMKKRTRLKENRKKVYTEKMQQEERIKQKHKEADEWLQRRHGEEQNQKREKQVQKELDNYLKEVRQNQAELKKSLELMNALAKLRKARKESAIRKGTEPSHDHDEIFSNVHSSAREHFLQRIASCEEEEKKLRSFLVEEQRVEEARIKRKRLEEEDEKRAKLIEDREKALFGPEVTLDISDPMWPMQQLHKQASSNWGALAHTRQQWDWYISDAGTRIPTTWVEPPVPSSEEWAKYLTENDD